MFLKKISYKVKILDILYDTTFYNFKEKHIFKRKLKHYFNHSISVFKKVKNYKKNYKLLNASITKYILNFLCK